MTTPYHSHYWAQLLTLKRPADSVENLSRSIANARVDLNPHQVDAALFALRSPLSNGAILADEVGLGKTIEAGLVIAQRWAERKRRILLIVPASLRKQWQMEMEGKFYLPTTILDSKAFNQARQAGRVNPFEAPGHLVICSYHFASAKAWEISRVPWDLVVIDEAHRLRNVYKKSSKLARRIADALGQAPKLLLTATPLQNSLMELYGLVSVIDEHVFGDPDTFRDQFVRAGSEDGRNEALRARLERICARTLRKQVIEYIPFTKRVAITQEFEPTDEEQRLYDLISSYLQRERLFALPASQRTLITLVLRKLLASSTFAIAGTLRRLVARLENLSGDITSLLDEDDLEDLEILREELSDENSEPSEVVSHVDAEAPSHDLLKRELNELRSYAELAESITLNAKGEALIPALATALDRAVSLGAERKAIIFTESRRTQEYLFDLLSENGYDGQIVMINGSNNDPMSKRIYEDWLRRHEGQDIVTGSRAVDMKTAIMEYFRDQATILIGTEAAAEGVNLQFCSLVVNYDLPWNPQRIEQRIGRCHRYGQKHDVVVLNFLNRRNAADQRVYQLLSEKFRLFDGVFGASDEVLGALESGVDIERRIAQVYQECRTTEEIAAAFDKLQEELDAEIQTRMAEARRNLLEHFDEDVRARLRVYQDKTLESLSERERWLLELTRTELNGDARFDRQKPRFFYTGPDFHRGYYHLNWKEAEKNGDIFYRQDHSLAVRIIEQALTRELPPAELTLDYKAYGATISVIEPLVGTSGWLELSKLTVEALDTEEFLIFSAATDAGDILDQEVCEKLMLLPARVKGPVRMDTPNLAPIRERQVKELIWSVEQRNARFFDEEVLKLDRWADDLKLGLERELKEIDKEIKEARRAAQTAVSLTDKLAAQKRLRQIEDKRNRKRRELYNEQDRIDEQRDELIRKIEAQLKQRQEVKQVFIVRWRVV